jgi:hypothetical protein
MEMIENVKKSILVFICSVAAAHSMHILIITRFFNENVFLQCEVDIC